MRTGRPVVTYILKKPTRMITDAGAANATAAAESAGSGPDRAIVDEVKNAFVRVFGRLEELLGDRWTGACDRLRERFRSDYDETEAAERTVDEVSVAYIQGRATAQVFHEALDHYEQAWTAAAVALASADRAQERACAECGRTGMTVVVFDDAGKPHCRACLAGRP